MRNIWIIAKRELSSFYLSPLAYIVYALFYLILGFFFANDFFQLVDALSKNQMGSSQAFEHTELFRYFWQSSLIIFIFLLPSITMSLFAEEKRSGTFELLFTKPINDWEVVIGKYLASFIEFAIMISGTLIYVLILALTGKPDYGWLLTIYIGVLLVGASFLSLGLLASSITDNQVVAAIFGFVILLIFWLFTFLSQSLPAFSGLFDYIAIPMRFESFSKGLIDLKDITFFICFTGFVLFLTTRIIESRKWR
ncbi:MAG: ABC transporter permease subunit [bacterium]